MDIRLLKEYIDICELVKDAEQELKRLQGKRPTVAVDKVDTQKRVLEERIREMKKQRTKCEAWISNAPVRMQRIIRYKFFEGLSWEEVADRMGRGATGDSVRMELKRFAKEK